MWLVFPANYESFHSSRLVLKVQPVISFRTNTNKQTTLSKILCTSHVSKVLRTTQIVQLSPRRAEEREQEGQGLTDCLVFSYSLHLLFLIFGILRHREHFSRQRVNIRYLNDPSIPLQVKGVLCRMLLNFLSFLAAKSCLISSKKRKQFFITKLA